jgi:hypothetical protein
MSKYRVSLGFHKNSTSISETIPYVLIIIENGKELDLPAVQMKLCQLLIACVKNKFNSEINSPTYQVFFSKSCYYLDK